MIKTVRMNSSYEGNSIKWKSIGCFNVKFLCPISKMESSARGSEHRFLREFSVGNADTVECMEKLKKYETAYARRLKAKYFSKKAFNGGDIFDLETTVDNETIKSSRWPCTRSFADPIQTVEDPSRPPTSVAETSSTPNKKTPTKKIC